MKVLVLNTQEGDYQGFYIDGKLVDSAHSLGEGNSFYFLLEKAEEYGFKRSDVKEKELNDKDDETLQMDGDFPTNLSELTGDY